MKPADIIICLFLLLLLPVTKGWSQQIHKEDTIKIGLLIPDMRSKAAFNGARLAVRIANEDGGLKGVPFKIVERSMEGAWGTGSREATSLIFDEHVSAIVGSHDGRNAHIVEQVTTKTRLVFLSAWAGDPTLSQAFVPWYFSCVPNNTQQAALLSENIYNKKKYRKAALVSDNGYDSELAMNSFVKKTKAARYSEPVLFHYDEKGTDLKDIVNQIIENNPDCIVLFGNPLPSAKIISLLQEKESRIPVYGTLSLLDENNMSGISLRNYENVILVSPEHWLNPSGSSFIEEYQTIYGEIPGAVAAYSYDAVNMIIEAVRTVGASNEKIQKALAGIKYKGITGETEFDARGNRKGPFNLIVIKNGHPAAID